MQRTGEGQAFQLGRFNPRCTTAEQKKTMKFDAQEIKNVNPYAPSQLELPKQTWWSRIVEALLGVWRFSSTRNFSRGDAMICGGIAYFIDPDDRNTLYAGSPSSDESDERFALIAREAIRNLPEFLSLNEHSASFVGNRRMVVRIVFDYTGIFADYTRAVQILEAPLAESRHGIKLAPAEDCLV